MADLFSTSGEGGPGKQPSNATKARLTQLIEQNVSESGKLFRSLCQRSGSREVRDIMTVLPGSYDGSFTQVLLKAAKRMAAQEGTMENTLNVSCRPVKSVAPIT